MYSELNVRQAELEASPKRAEVLALLPLEVMVHPLELRFRYHFLGDKPTNRLDKVCSAQTTKGTC